MARLGPGVRDIEFITPEGYKPGPKWQIVRTLKEARAWASETERTGEPAVSPISGPACSVPIVSSTMRIDNGVTQRMPLLLARIAPWFSKITSYLKGLSKRR